MATGRRLDRHAIAMRVVREFRDGDVVNLGIGIPTLCSSYLPPDKEIILHSENGVLGFGPIAEEHERDVNLLNAGGQFVTPKPGMAIFHSGDSFNMIRGGHIDVTVLGALQVSEKGDVANWALEGREQGNIGGAMDLVAGARKVIIAMEHITKQGKLKIVKECSYPLTGRGCVKLIVSDMAVIEITGKGLVLKEVAPGFNPEDVQAATEPTIIVSENLKEMEL